MQDSDSTDKLLQDLQNPQAYTRLAAAFELGQQAPTDQRTLEALQAAADNDADTAVRSAAAKSYQDLTSAELLNPPGDMTLAMRGDVSTSSHAGEGAEKFFLAAFLSFGLNAVVTLQFGEMSPWALLGVLFIVNLLVAFFFGLARQDRVMGGILVGFAVWVPIAPVVLVISFFTHHPFAF